MGGRVSKRRWRRRVTTGELRDQAAEIEMEYILLLNCFMCHLAAAAATGWVLSRVYGRLGGT